MVSKMNWIRSHIKLFILLIYDFLIYIDLLFCVKNKRIIIFDIDNTLADTWPSISINNNNQFEIYKNLKLIKDAKTLVENSQNKFDEIIFLSARHPFYWNASNFWIKNNFDLQCFSLRLVPKVNMKVKYWKKLSKFNKITIIDDLSYNHENNEVKFYNTEISFLQKSKKIIYYGFSDISTGLKKINERL